MKVMLYGRSSDETKLVGVATFNLGDFLNSQMTTFNSKEKLTFCEDRRACIGYQLAFEVKDDIEENASLRTDAEIRRKYFEYDKARHK